MITANNQFEIDGSGIKYEEVINSVTTEIRSVARVGQDNNEEKVYVVLSVVNGDGQNIGSAAVELAAFDVDAYTPSGGTNSTEDWFNQVEQAIQDYLEALPSNSGVTFTIG